MYSFIWDSLYLFLMLTIRLFYKALKKRKFHKQSKLSIRKTHFFNDCFNILGRQLVAAASSGYGDDCCPPVVDPYTWLALIAGKYIE